MAGLLVVALSTLHAKLTNMGNQTSNNAKSVVSAKPQALRKLSGNSPVASTLVGLTKASTTLTKASTTLTKASTTLTKVSAPAETLTKVPTVDDLKKSIRSSEFQSILAYNTMEAAVKFAQSVGGGEQLDCSVCHLPQKEFPSVLHAWAFKAWKSQSIPKAELVSETLQIIGVAGGVTREAANVFDQNGESAAIHATRSTAFCDLIQSAPDVIDINARSNNRSVLMELLAITEWTGGQFTQRECDLYDDRGVRCVELGVDPFTFNKVDKYGWCALTIAVQNLRINTLRALLHRMPTISIEPELDMVSDDGKPAISLDYAMQALRAPPLANEETDRKRAETMIAAARSCLFTYRQRLKSVICDALPNVLPDICTIIRAFTDRPAVVPDPAVVTATVSAKN